MIKLNKHAWVLIADGEKALILRNDGDSANPELTVRLKETQENPPDREQSTDRPGRMNDGPSVQRSALDATDWHQLEKARFAVDLAGLLYESAHRGEFHQLVVVADPQVLGELRSQFHKEVSDKIIGEIPKVLTNHPLEEIVRHVVLSLAEVN